MVYLLVSPLNSTSRMGSYFKGLRLELNCWLKKGGKRKKKLVVHLDGVRAGGSNEGDGSASAGREDDLVGYKGVLIDHTVHVSTGNVVTDLRNKNN